MVFVTVADLQKIELSMNKEWYKKLFKNKQSREILLPIIQHLEKYAEGELYPSIVNAFEAFNYAAPADVKVVIFSPSPCDMRSTASGLAYAVKTKKLDKSASLALIDKCLKQTCSVTVEDLSLVSLAKQGVLLLNLAMCSRLGKESEMLELWRPFIDRVITIILTEAIASSAATSIDIMPAFFLWGSTITSRVEPTLLRLINMLSIAPTKMNIHMYTGTPFADPNNRNPIEFSKCTSFSDYNKSICQYAENLQNKTSTTNAAGADTANQELYDKVMSRIINWGKDFVVEDFRIYDNVIFTDGSADNKKSAADAGYGIYFSKGFLQDRCVAGNMKYSSTKLASGGSELKAVLETLKLINKAIALKKEQPAASQQSAPTTQSTAEPATTQSAPALDVFINPDAINQETGQINVKNKFNEGAKTGNSQLIIILSDSQYAINTVNIWADDWVRESRLEGKCNLDIVCDILVNKATLKEAGYLVKLCHIKAHRAEPTNKDSLDYFTWKGNKIVDTLANIGRVRETYFDTPASIPM